MYQQVNGVWVEVFEFDTMPGLPVYGLTEFEREQKEKLESMPFPSEEIREDALKSFWQQFKYAEALTKAIDDQVITEPGKYGIEIKPRTNEYVVYKIIEE